MLEARQSPDLPLSQKSTSWSCRIIKIKIKLIGGMTSLGYVRGKNLSDGHIFYRRDVGGVRTHKVHVCRPGHWQVSRILRFRDMLQEDYELRHKYQSLKLELEARNEFGIKEYLADKASFIDGVVGLPPEDA